MREILFRGKRIDNGVWVYGDILHDDERFFVVNGWIIEGINEDFTSFDCDCLCEIGSETVGQYTGLTDKNGTKIFEGDVFQLEDDIIGVVDFNHGCFFLTEYGIRGTWTESGYDECGGGWGVIDCEPMHFWYINKMEVVGNIHDNPKWLEVR